MYLTLSEYCLSMRSNWIKKIFPLGANNFEFCPPFFFLKMLWTRSYNPIPGWSLDLVSWTEDNEAFVAGEENCLCSFVTTKITGLIQFLLTPLWGLKEVVAAAPEIRWWWFILDAQSAGKTHSCAMLSVGGAGCGLSLKGDWSLDGAAGHSTAWYRAGEAAC